VVKRGDPLIELDSRKLETELDLARKDVLQKEAEAERLRGAVPSDEAGAQVASLGAAASRENVRRLELELESATLRAPIDGVVMTKDVEKRTGEVIQLGTPLLEIAALDCVGSQGRREPERCRPTRGSTAQGTNRCQLHPLQPDAYTLNSKLTQARQVSAAAEPREQEHVFVVTIEEVNIPANILPSMRPGLTGRVWFELGKRPLGWIWGKRIWSWFQILLMKW
jgi:multidrug efflux pump subunit AcrA (membrane-fusion protein)